MSPAYALKGLPPVAATRSPPTTKEKTTEPSGIARPLATRRTIVIRFQAGRAAGDGRPSRPSPAPLRRDFLRRYQTACSHLALHLGHPSLNVGPYSEVVDRVTR